MTNKKELLAQFIETYPNKSECECILEKEWPKLKTLLPDKWWFSNSPLRHWLAYPKAYKLAIDLLEQEFIAINEKFPESFNKWVGGIGIPGEFWSKRFESIIIFFYFNQICLLNQ